MIDKLNKRIREFRQNYVVTAMFPGGNVLTGDHGK
jgi:hypothetical protein